MFASYTSSCKYFLPSIKVRYAIGILSKKITCFSQKENHIAPPSFILSLSSTFSLSFSNYLSLLSFSLHEPGLARQRAVPDPSRPGGGGRRADLELGEHLQSLGKLIRSMEDAMTTFLSLARRAAVEPNTPMNVSDP